MGTSVGNGPPSAAYPDKARWVEVEWILLGVGALIVGISKTSFGGLGSLAVALFALAMPTKESTAAALILLIVGDVVAVLRYRKAADWRLLRALLPAVIPGLLLGAWFLSIVDDLVLKRSIGWLLLGFVLIQLGWQLIANRPREASLPDGGGSDVSTSSTPLDRLGEPEAELGEPAGELGAREGALGAREGALGEPAAEPGEPAAEPGKPEGAPGEPMTPHRALSIGAGVAAGFTTMAANAAGPVMALYLQLARVEKLRFLGTGAWYFFIINLTKVPLSASLGLFTPSVLTTAAMLIPLVLIGTLIGMAIISRVPQRAFDIITLLASIVAAGALLAL